MYPKRVSSTVSALMWKHKRPLRYYCVSTRYRTQLFGKQAKKRGQSYGLFDIDKWTICRRRKQTQGAPQKMCRS
eukprot:6188632-Pleurochrysis_carterae.AAC.3